LLLGLSASEQQKYPGRHSAFFQLPSPNTYKLKLKFSAMVDGFMANRVGITEHFLSDSLCTGLLLNLQRIFNDHQFKAAGTGDSEHLLYRQNFRGDFIYWLDRKHQDEFENQFFDLMDAFVLYLTETCYTGILNYEFHYTRYETGTFYKKHLDQFKNNDKRKYSMIVYLNHDWLDQEGGALCIHFADGLQLIYPHIGKAVFFQSNELEHEVLIASRPRFSITGWLKVE
jgi:SM-20-related protein